MKTELWGDILDRLEDKYGKVEVKNFKETRSDDIGQELISDIQSVEVETDLGRVKIELVTSPMILDKKTHYTHTGGAKASVEFVLSDTEKTQKIRAFKYDEDLEEWVAINTNNNFLI